MDKKHTFNLVLQIKKYLQMEYVYYYHSKLACASMA